MQGKAGGSRDTRAEASELEVARISLACLVSVILLAVVAINALSGINDSTSSARKSNAEVLTLSEYELLSRADRIESPVYWVGRQPGTDHFELEREANGSLYIRYVAGKGGLADPRSNSLTVASYPVVEARRRLEQAARARGKRISHQNGSLMLGSGSSYGVYIVFDELPELQVEIYSPHRGEAAKLAASGALTPLHWIRLD